MGITPEEEKLARVRLNFFACMRSDWLLRLMTLYGGAAQLLKRSPAEIAGEGGVSLLTDLRLAAETAAADPERELELASKAGVKVLTAQEDGYPDLLKTIYDPPLAIYVLGELRNMPAAALVGTRKATPYGLRTAGRLASGLAASGVAVASGLARGIDTASHQAALAEGGVTWAALGSGLNSVYPRENKKLVEKIAACGGAVLSEFPMETGPMPANFPRRNRVVSGLSLATVVVEGGFESGALITARFALDQGRDVLAVPGPVDSPMSKGPNFLIKNGAQPVEDAEDIVSSFPYGTLSGVKRRKLRENPPRATAALKELSPDAGAAYTAIAAQESGLNADELTVKLAWPVQRTAAALFELEVAAVVVLRAGRYAVVSTF
ncbi:MAG: DNA protecting protein DprA [Elusimicrobia bacterium RIFOXYA12_FULL_57_11]|nr:MAG: DNA protecting protein DprA [Elusimicrobia bacterium RIFOXYA12_FULL_57_11]